MLARMNGFRVTILVLFCLTVGLMFYAVTVVIPGRQEQYELYRTMQKSNEYRQRNAEHLARMEQLGPDVEAPEVSNARSEAEEGERKRQQEINEAEESSVLASARRKEEERTARAAAEEAAAPAALGRVASFNREWNSILFTPEGAKTPLNDGLVIAVRRGDYIVCEAVVDGRDEESGQVSATVKQAIFAANGNVPQDTPTPAAGDEIILSPFLSGRDLRDDNEHFGAALRQMEQGDMTTALPQQPAPAAEPAPSPAADAPAPAAQGEDGMPALEPIPTEDDDDMPKEGAAPAAENSTPAAALPVQPTQLPSFPTTENRNGLPEVEAALVPIP